MSSMLLFPFKVMCKDCSLLWFIPEVQSLYALVGFFFFIASVFCRLTVYVFCYNLIDPSI